MYNKENMKGAGDFEDQIDDQKSNNNIFVNGKEMEIEDYLAKMLYYLYQNERRLFATKGLKNNGESKKWMYNLNLDLIPLKENYLKFVKNTFWDTNL